MLIKRTMFDSYMKRIGVYFIDSESEREVYDFDGNLVDCSKLDWYDANQVDNLIDDFEDGYNQIEDGYEVLGDIGITKFTIKRKIERMEYFDK